MDSAELRAPAPEAPAATRNDTGGSGGAYALLSFTMACWGGNAVAGRLAVGEISPMVITSLRWGIVAVFLIGLVPRGLMNAWPEIRRHWVKITLMGIGGLTLFNALYYVAAHHTTAVNIALLQGSIPMFVVIGALLVYRTRIGILQMAGIVTTLVGVVVVATQGHIGALAGLRLNIGDLLLLVACFLYAGYTLALRGRPEMPGLVFFAAMAIVAFVTSLPLVGYEIVAGTVLWPTPKGWMILAFIAVFPSFLAQVTYIRGVELIGPGRAGLFNNLIPLFGAFFAVIVLGEPFALFHLVALVLIVGGILIAEAPARIGEYRAQAGGRKRQSA